MVSALLVAAAVTCAAFALADHHHQDACDPLHVGNCQGPGDQQNAEVHLGEFLAGTPFSVALYWKMVVPPTCQVAFAFAADPPIYLRSNHETFTPNPDNAALIASMDTSTGNSPYVAAYQHTRFNLPNGTPECPTCNKELAMWLVDGQLFDGPTEPFNIDPAIPDTNAPLGWMHFQTHAFTQPGVYTLSLHRGWVQGPRPGATSCYYCGFDLEGPGTGGSGGCDSDVFHWTIEENDAVLFTIEVVEELTPPPPAVPSLQRPVLIVLACMLILLAFVVTPRDLRGVVR
jgi:hypothetical protein